MCGICGVYDYCGGRVDRGLLCYMRDVLEHRGPDDCGDYFTPDGKIGLGSRRLSIVDLSEAGRMPIHNEDNKVHIVYNGEVYNANRDLRPGLEQRGHRFISHTDTEVILHLYEEKGTAVLNDLRGMFAIAIWDENKDQLFLARDRIGIKPIYYTFHDGQFRFASEIKSLLIDPSIPRKLNAEALYHFMSFITIPAPLTLFEGIYKIPAGHFAIVNNDGHLRVEQYWDVFDHVQVRRESEAQIQARLRELLYEATELRMISDVPFGALLSGGVDSSTNVALMSQILKLPVRTYSIGWKNMPQYNEFNEAQFVADLFKTDHHAIQIGEEDLINFIPDLVYYQDEPIADPVCVPVYYVCKLARDSGTTVLQVGEGADEQFAYPAWIGRIQRDEQLNPLRMIPQPIRRWGFEGVKATLGKRRDPFKLEFVRRLANDEPTFWGGNDVFAQAEKSHFLSPAFQRKLSGLTTYDNVVKPLHERFKATAPLTNDRLAWMSYVDLKIRLPELLLMRVDKMSMATSIEARVPFLDHKFVEYAMGIPQALKIGAKDPREPKGLLKKAVKDLLPESVIYRQKVGFGTPTSDFYQSLLGQLSHAKISAFAKRTEIFNPTVIDEFLEGGGWRVWFLLNFVLWHELWIEQQPRESLTVIN